MIHSAAVGSVDGVYQYLYLIFALSIPNHKSSTASEEEVAGRLGISLADITSNEKPKMGFWI
jgi:hypothetical protein